MLRTFIKLLQKNAVPLLSENQIPKEAYYTKESIISQLQKWKCPKTLGSRLLFNNHDHFVHVMFAVYSIFKLLIDALIRQILYTLKTA